MFPIQRKDIVVAVEEETLPSVEEIVPRYPDAKPNFHKTPEVVTERLQSTMMVEHLAAFKTNFGLPYNVELVPAGDDEVRVHSPDTSPSTPIRSPSAIRSPSLR